MHIKVIDSMKKEEKAKNTYPNKVYLGIGFLFGIVVAGLIAFLVLPRSDKQNNKAMIAAQNSSINNTSPATLSELLLLPKDQILSVDIERMNLLCAEGLKGSENLNIQDSLTTLDEWAEIVKKDTQKRMSSFYQNPAKYDNSVNLFKVINLILTLKQEVGLDYNQDIMKRTTYLDSQDVFIHGCVASRKKGGCISIPVTCVAVGRRLGYPLKLVLTKEHVFFRWEDGKERFNAEACCPGCDSHPDEYYMNWPNKLSQEEVKNGCFLRSLTPEEELGLFLEIRGHCLYDEGRMAEAMVMYAYAYQLMPDSMARLANIEKVLKCEVNNLR